MGTPGGPRPRPSSWGPWSWCPLCLEGAAGPSGEGERICSLGTADACMPPEPHPPVPRELEAVLPTGAQWVRSGRAGAGGLWIGARPMQVVTTNAPGLRGWPRWTSTGLPLSEVGEQGVRPWPAQAQPPAQHQLRAAGGPPAASPSGLGSPWWRGCLPRTGPSLGQGLLLPPGRPLEGQDRSRVQPLPRGTQRAAPHPDQRSPELRHAQPHHHGKVA